MNSDWFETARRLPPSAYRRYLSARGWREGKAGSDRFWRYQTTVGAAEVSVDVPRHPELPDYGRRVAELLEVLAAADRRSPRALLFDLGQPDADVIGFRFAGADTESGTISIADSGRIRDAQRRLLLSTAHSTLEPRAHHPRLSRSEAVAFVESCREAPSHPGSFISPILVPVSPALGDAPVDDPFPRRVTLLLATALNRTAEALSAGEDERLLDGADDGLSANFLGALAELRPPGGQGFTEIALSWAARRPAPSIPAKVRLDHQLFAPLGEAARVLKATSPSPGTEIEGYVHTFERKATDPSQPGEIALLATLDDHPHTVKVHITLDPQAYARAMELHREAKRVRVTGTLAKEGRRHVLRSPGDLVVVRDDEDR